MEEVIRTRRGVCQDFLRTWELPVCVRWGCWPATSYGGYLRTHPAPGKERLTGADASHATLVLRILSERRSWVDFDPTNNLLPAEEHITVAFGRDFSDVSPVSGILVGGGSHAIKVAVDVREIGEVRA